MANDEQSSFEAPETIGRMLVTTWALLYSMDGEQLVDASGGQRPAAVHAEP